MAMTVVAIAVIVLANLLATTSQTECSSHICVDGRSGRDEVHCLNGMSVSCQTLQYVLENLASLNNSEIVLQGDHSLNNTLHISDADNLTIRGTSDTPSTIRCFPPQNGQEEGPGFSIVSVSNLHIAYLTLEGCGTLQLSTSSAEGAENIGGADGDNSHSEYRSAVYILNSTNITFDSCSFLNGIGQALSLFDTTGIVTISDSFFIGNAVPEKDRAFQWGGGGIYIEFTYCTPGIEHCNPRENTHNSNSNYTIRHCGFSHNTVTAVKTLFQSHIIQFPLLIGSDSNRLVAQGGGIAITLKGTGTGNMFTILNCNFTNNTAARGGGMKIWVQDDTTSNIITIDHCNFTNNSGGLQIGFIIFEDGNIYNNTIILSNTSFVNNSGKWGGGFAFFASRSLTNRKNKLIFKNCYWKQNSASFGAAANLMAEAWNSYADGDVPTPLFHNCSFEDNVITSEANFLFNEHTKSVMDSGALHLHSMTANISGHTMFKNNTGSALCINSGSINVLENSTLNFTDNKATLGGAMALLGNSDVKVFPDTMFRFIRNSATDLGGAIYSTLSDQSDFITSHKCFFRYSTVVVHPDKWTAHFDFTNNTAKYGNAIYTDSLLPCAKQVGESITNTTRALQWKSFTYKPENQPNTIATSPAIIQFNFPTDQAISPGERVFLNLTATDDLHQNITSVYAASLHGDSGIETSNAYISDGHIQINGKPNTNFTLTLQTVDTRHVSTTRSGRLADCPLGFTLQENKCKCSADKNEKHFVGIPKCNTTSFEVLLQVGHWAGCINDNTLVTAYCPTGYCSYQSAVAGLVAIPRTCQQVDQHSVCVAHRRGQLCGECEDGYTVFYHSRNFRCDKCPYGAVGLLVYVVAELIPLTLLFVAIMILKPNLTSGLVQSFILFAQTIHLINYNSQSTMQSGVVSSLITGLLFLAGFCNLDFFHLEEMSFCLWEGATVLHNLVFRYLTTAYSILLLALLIIMLKHFSFKTRKIVGKLGCCQKTGNWIMKEVVHSSPLVHSISTFLVLSYTQYTMTSFQILSRLYLYGEGTEKVRSVVHLSGQVEYFGKDHIPYALVALCVIVFLSIPPPLILISYPLLWKIKAKWSCMKKRDGTNENDTTWWPIRKLLPLIDSLQGNYKDKYRLFAGLLFLWRMILTAIFAFASNPTEYFLSTAIALLLILSIHALAGPYKKRIYNRVDILMFANLSIINALGWYINTVSYNNTLGATKMILMYMPLLYIIVILVIKVLSKFEVTQHQLEKMKILQMLFYDQQPQTKRVPGELVKGGGGAFPADEDLFGRAEELNTSPNVTRLESLELTEVHTQGSQ